MVDFLDLMNLFLGVVFRDLRLHKNVLQNGVLPDGTELCYFARGKVVVRIRSFPSFFSCTIYVRVVLSKITSIELLCHLNVTCFPFMMTPWYRNAWEVIRRVLESFAHAAKARYCCCCSICLVVQYSCYDVYF